jgi:hypothetical protein
MVRLTIIIVIVLVVATALVWVLAGPSAAFDVVVFAALCTPIYVAIWVCSREVPEEQSGLLHRWRQPRRRRRPPHARRERVCCPDCGCDLTGTRSPICPKCGIVFTEQDTG